MKSLAPLDKLISALNALPSIGRRSAERMAIKLAKDKDALAPALIRALQEVVESITACSRCGNFTVKTDDPCQVCVDPRRHDKILCVVEDPGDLIRIEQSGSYRGRYHVLGGTISPRKKEGLGDLTVDALVRRVKEEGAEEVVLALNSDVESDATASFLHDILTQQHIRVSRLAFGLPAGSGIAFSDPVTLARAIQGRQKMA